MGNLDEDAYHKLNHQEDALVNHRLTWLLAGQPLLFLAYATAATAKRGQNEELLSEAARQAALSWIPVAGIVMALAIWVGMWGAAVAMVKLRGMRAKGQFAGVRDLSSVMGMTPPLLIPPAFAIVWWRMMA